MHNSAISADYPAVLKIKWNPCKCPTSPSHWPSLNLTPTTLSHFVGRASKPGRSTLEFNTRVSLSLGPFLFCSFFPLHPLFLLITDFWECGRMRMLCVIWVWGRDKKLIVFVCVHMCGVWVCVLGGLGVASGCTGAANAFSSSLSHTLSSYRTPTTSLLCAFWFELGDSHTHNWPGRKSLLKHFKKPSSHKP